LEISLGLNPRDRRALYLTRIGIALFFDRGFDEALEKLFATLQEFPGYATPRIVSLPRATRIWGGSTMHERWFSACGALHPSWCRMPCSGVTQSTASYSYRVCGWLLAKHMIHSNRAANLYPTKWVLGQ
jgi:hypothetical protein